MSVLNLIRPELLNSPNYVPGGEDSKFRLHANELPWSPVEMNSIALNHYPDTQLQLKLQEQMAARYGVNINEMTLTRGSDDGIDLVTRLFLTAGKDAFMQFPPTFPMYAFYVRLQQGELIQCPLDQQSDFSLSLETIQSYWKPNCKIIMFCRPNNPTGNLIDLELIAATCALYTNRAVIVVDEAYIEFSNSPSATTLIQQFENLVVLRTMSKAGGLAGLRLGCIMAQSTVINAFNKIIAPYIISSSVISLALQALNNKDWFPTVIERIKASRNLLIEVLENSPVIEKVLPSETNFVLVKTQYARELALWLAEKGIAIRDFPPASLLHDHLRLTVGNEEQNQMLIAELASFFDSISRLNDAENLIY